LDYRQDARGNEKTKHRVRCKRERRKGDLVCCATRKGKKMMTLVSYGEKC